jgi:hypothetical protein
MNEKEGDSFGVTIVLAAIALITWYIIDPTSFMLWFHHTEVTTGKIIDGMTALFKLGIERIPQ